MYIARAPHVCEMPPIVSGSQRQWYYYHCCTDIILFIEQNRQLIITSHATSEYRAVHAVSQWCNELKKCMHDMSKKF